MVLTTPEGWWDAATVEDARAYLQAANEHTEEFIQPFLEARKQEVDQGSSGWAVVSLYA